MIPLAERMRPVSLDGYFGQKHLVGQGAILRNAIESDRLPSMILWGPPGVGKTTLAHIISQQLKRKFIKLSAINSGVKDIRKAIEDAEQSRFFNSPVPILFVDEIHRFSKSQQDSLLGAVEKGTLVLIGATTENPSFEVISALLSRSQVYVLKSLTKEEQIQILNHAIANDEELRKLKIELYETEALLRISGGDVRKLLNALELVCNQYKEEAKILIDNDVVQKVIQENLALYDKNGEMHYDLISAFIKSVRGSDPNATVYYLARMIEGGEDPKFICRRMLILASEDIGMANPNALLLANACFSTIERIGMPEGRIVMSQTAIYLAESKKSNATYVAINKAQAEVRRSGNLPVPLHLRNAPTKLLKDMDYGKEYQYAHDFKPEDIKHAYLPQELKGTKFYERK